MLNEKCNLLALKGLEKKTQWQDILYNELDLRKLDHCLRHIS